MLGLEGDVRYKALRVTLKQKHKTKKYNIAEQKGP